jgi:hypothetical protein
VPEQPEASALIARITSEDADLRMPQKGKPLTAEQIDLLRRWIAAGAPFMRHWADAPPVKLPLPRVRHAAWPRGELDYYVLARLEAEGLDPNDEADRYQLVRRLYLDLIGLPPSIVEADAFVNDGRPDAYERLVDRLLASPQFGERWARWWLDLARYADSNGYESDEPRTMWPYRDWVIRALNANMPFDRFTIVQLAGDLLAEPSQEDLIATAFHRNSLINTEAGAKGDEFKDAAVKDRLETTATVWLGATIGCAQCHNHKYDPYTQVDYYRLYAFFNNTTDKAVAEESDTIPILFGDQREVTRLQYELYEIEQQIEPTHPSHADDQVLWETEIRRQLAAGEIITPAPPQEVIEALPVAPAKRDKRQATLVNQWYRKASPRLKALRDRQVEIFQRLEDARSIASATVMIMREGTKQPTHVHIRGDFLQPGELVQPGVPAVFGVPLKGVPANRMALARWLVDPRHPRTARVTVNRLWDVLFGEGLVSTSDDFGAQGDLPSHGDLLDWLAVEFVEQGWDIKHLLRTIVTSSTYRQSARISSELLERDRYNRLLARGARYRVEAEAVRDVALAASGQLAGKMEGPSVFPPQPDAVFENLFIEGGFKTWPESVGGDRYRRAVYTFIKRTALHPLLNNFDAPNRIACTVHRKRSNTPSAALNTLNGPEFVEASGALGLRMAQFERDAASVAWASAHAPEAKDGDAAARIVYGFRLCATRPPQQRELAALLDLYESALARFTNDPAAAHAAVAAGRMAESETNNETKIDNATLAAWMAVANTLLNMDATLTRS